LIQRKYYPKECKRKKKINYTSESKILAMLREYYKQTKTWLLKDKFVDNAILKKLAKHFKTSITKNRDKK
jgi:hypothetical protein